ncbi:leucine-rich repeat-containing G-protein coupled receptor 5-like [Aplochiton taeniatus]
MLKPCQFINALLLVTIAGYGSTLAGFEKPIAGGTRGDCPTRCQCDREGMLLRVDCSDLGLTVLPGNLSVFTSYLDLSMNNLTQLPSNSLAHLHFLEELRLAGNDLALIPKAAFAGLFNLKVLMLQNNQMRSVPDEALQNLRNLQSLRLDANHISSVAVGSFHGLQSLRHLWLDDNTLTEVPITALSALPALQAMTLALNRITHIPDQAFSNLTSLVVLHLNNNRIVSLGTHCFSGLHSLETLDLNYNSLVEFPVAIRSLKNLKELGFHSNSIQSIPEHAFTGNPSLLTIFFYDNPIQFVGRSAFQHLPELRTLSLNGAAKITEFPDLTGTKSLESLTITGARITSLPTAVCDQLPNLQVLDLSFNRIHTLPSFGGCDNLRKIDLHHNEIEDLQKNTFQGLASLRSLDLAWNRLRSLDAHSFSSLPALSKLDLSSNRLSSLPVAGLQSLTHLKLSGNPDLLELLPASSLPKLRVMELPHAFQCCAFVSCEKRASPWEREDVLGKDNFGHRDAVLSSQDHELEDFLLDFDDEPKSHHSVQCSPAPGPFRPCLHLFGSWLIRGGVWLIAALSLVCNGLVMLSVFLSAAAMTPPKVLVGLLALVNWLMGVWSGSLALVDAATFGSFSRYGAHWEGSVACKLSGFLSVFASETSVFLLTLAALERGLASPQRHKTGLDQVNASPMTLRLAAVLCFLLGLAVALPPLVADYGTTSLCLPVPDGDPASLGFTVTMVLLNALCYLLMTLTYTRLYCRPAPGSGPGAPEKGPDSWGAADGAMTRHVAWLLFADCLLSFPVAFLSFSSLLRLPSVGPEVVKGVLLVVLPLPACVNPLLYLLFNPLCRVELGTFVKRARGVGWRLSRRRRMSLASVASDDAEKQSCDSTQALVLTGGPGEEEAGLREDGGGKGRSQQAGSGALVPCH